MCGARLRSEAAGTSLITRLGGDAASVERRLRGRTEAVAQRMLGMELVTSIGGKLTGGRIVEVEAYHETDAASHSSRGRTARTEVMFHAPGHCYVYFIYGMHYCMNIVTEREGVGAAVLIRAIEPLVGIDVMAERRGTSRLQNLARGPARLCQALGIEPFINGQHVLTSREIALLPGRQVPRALRAVSPRIGITKAAEVPWRFYIEGNPFVSRHTG